MTEDTKEEFARRVEPSLQAMARYAARRVAPADRDPVVEEALIRAWQGRAAYDEVRDTMTGWLLRITDEACQRPRPLRTQATLVELVDESPAAVGVAVVAPPGSELDVELALDGLDARERQLVDLRYFVGLDVATVAEVVQVHPEEVTAELRRALTTLARSTGEHDEDRMHRRLSIVAGRWQDEQPRPPRVPLDSLDRRLSRRPRRWVLVAAGAVILLVGGGVAFMQLGSGDTPRASPHAAPSPPPEPERAAEIVPWRNLAAGHPVYRRDQNGLVVTPYDEVEVSGTISGTLRPGQALVFDVALTSPGVVSLRPCPDYTVTFGTHRVTGRLNCAQVPYYASLVRPDGKVSEFRPVLPAGVTVFFRIAVIAPDEPGTQKVLWTLDGPRQTPSLEGEVDVIE